MDEYFDSYFDPYFDAYQTGSLDYFDTELETYRAVFSLMAFFAVIGLVVGLVLYLFERMVRRVPEGSYFFFFCLLLGFIFGEFT